ncbi:MAG TPA: hypothetical protein VMV72_20120 [Verrucomicrobiae bacterium]|nr:hypothetical protein [Verrucomicrobiae bacterium]
MRIYKATEAEIDERLALDKRFSDAAFCVGFEVESEIPAGFCDLQDKIRDGLEREFIEKFDDREDRSKPWELNGSHELFDFPADLIPSERIVVWLGSDILSDRLLGVVLGYLERCRSGYCVIAAVCSGREIVGRNYLGRFVLNLEEIAVEESLAPTWTKQVHLLPIDEER